ncbi:uncharacterized protein EDB91DRAFT_1241835 [Suillus paluster]|uniref:uncharacterized protein n=1 Tax=Suillus paluster TaxID=48578 RepID=UPI001B880BD9|nr:uncharacterized protein EDB91DRAFT_1241835 [Suillus paluster]KAG1756789.1 hypothetical protein EDB91DRAFT_1241835 [Suillus paluster]
MPVHLHRPSSQYLARTEEAQAQNDKTAQSTAQANNASQEKQFNETTTTGAGSDSELIAIFNPDIHVCDIGDFAQLGFDEQVKRLADRAGFQMKMVQQVYQHVRTFKDAEEVVKSMHEAVLECAEVEIGRRAAGE